MSAERQACDSWGDLCAAMGDLSAPFAAKSHRFRPVLRPGEAASAIAPTLEASASGAGQYVRGRQWAVSEPGLHCHPRWMRPTSK